MNRNIAVLLTCHNRCKKTVACLKELFNSHKPNDVEFEVFLVDDRCTDNTVEEVKKLFPQVHVISGDGNLYWNRGMRKAWETALNSGDFYSFLWLNDDTMIDKSALQVLCSESNKYPDAIIVGSISSSTDRKLYTYGGYCLKNLLLKPVNTSLPCRFFNGNLVLVPKSVVTKIGILDERFQHSFGDFEYGLRAGKKNIKMYVTPIVGTCDRNPLYTKWTDRKYSIKERLKILYSPLGKNPFETFLVERYFSYTKAIVIFIYLHLKAIFPQIFHDRSMLK